MTTRQLFTEFRRVLPGTTRQEFDNLLAGEQLRKTVNASCPDLLNAISARIHDLAGEHGEPISNFDTEALRVIDLAA